MVPNANLLPPAHSQALQGKEPTTSFNVYSHTLNTGQHRPSLASSCRASWRKFSIYSQVYNRYDSAVERGSVIYQCYTDDLLSLVRLHTVRICIRLLVAGAFAQLMFKVSLYIVVSDNHFAESAPG